MGKTEMKSSDMVEVAKVAKIHAVKKILTTSSFGGRQFWRGTTIQ
jgi:hypothetical protein